MSKNKEYSISELLNNDEFISWVISGDRSLNNYWKSIKKKLSEDQISNFDEAERILKKLKSLNIDSSSNDLSKQSIDKHYIKLLESYSKSKKPKAKVFSLKRILKYAATIAILISLSVAGFYFTDHNNSFNDHLTASKFSSEDIILQTSENEFYKITEDTNSKWLTNSGEFISINPEKLSFIASDIFNSENISDYKLYIPTGKTYHLTLIDGTEVELNSNSIVSFNNSTISKQRDITLTGEAFFDVSHNKERPFVVKASDVMITVLGTEFNISNYSVNDFVRTTLVDGSVKISNSNEKVVLTPGDQATIIKGDKRINVQQADIQVSVAWMSGRMVFRNETLEVLIPKLNRWFGVKFIIENESLKKSRFTGTLKKENDLTHFLRILEYTEGIDYKVEQGKVRLFKN